MSRNTVLASAAAAAPSLALPTCLLRAFALDLRALAFLRIGLGMILLTDLAGRAVSLGAHYTDDGVLPRAGRIAMEWEFCEPWWMSLHMLSGAAWWQAGLFLAAAIAAGMLMAGYRTKLALVVSLILLISLHGRFPLLTQGGDMLLRCMLFWSIFLPLDARWSWSWSESETRHDEEKKNHGTYVVSIGTVAFVCQLAIMYLFTAMLKTSPVWRTEFSAAYYALSIDHFTSELGYVLLKYPRLLQGLTFASLILECVAPLLLLFPIRQTAVRIAIPLAFIGFHLGLAAAMDLGTFPWICVLFWAVLLPPAVWDYVEWLLRGTERLNPARARAEAEPRCIGSVLSNAIAAFFLFYVVLLNVNRMQSPLATVGHPPLSYLSKVTGLDQYWNMFSPGPYQFGGWVRLEGKTADGRLVNLYQPDEPLPDAKPVNVSNTYQTQYWRRCLVMMYEFQEIPHMEGGLRYFSRQWNATHPPGERIVEATFVHMREKVPPPFSASGQPRHVERHELCRIELPSSCGTPQPSTGPNAAHVNSAVSTRNRIVSR